MPIEPNLPLLTVRAIKAVPVMVPLNFVMGTSQQALREVPLLLIDVETEEGVTGRSYLFGYVRAALPAIAAILGEVEAQTRGKKADPRALFSQLNKRFTLIGVQGVVRMAIAGFDVALWDAVAIAAGKPLGALLGGEMKPLLAYNSCGLGLKNDLGALAAEAETLVTMGGFGAVKLRLGYPTLEGDIAAVQAVKKRIGDGVRLMVDYNQALSLDEALARGRRWMPKISTGWKSRSVTTIMPAKRSSRASSTSRFRSAKTFRCRPICASPSNTAPPTM